MKINICFGINDKYCQHCACTIASILYNSNPKDKYTFYIISNFISEQNKMMIKSLTHIRDFKIQFLIADMTEYKYLWQNNDLGISTFFRFKAFEWLNLDKVLYLDADIIVRDDIGILYNIDITDYYGAGVEDIISKSKLNEFNLPPETTYINAGVLLINLKKCRQDHMVEKLVEFVNKPWEKAMNDQEIINILWNGKIKLVDLIWNCMYSYNNTYEDKSYYNSMAQNPAIMHYITANKPWIAGSTPHLKHEYFKYLKLTPYYLDFILQYNMEENELILKKLNEISNKLN